MHTPVLLHKMGYKGVYITRKCFRDGKSFLGNEEENDENGLPFLVDLARRKQIKLKFVSSFCIPSCLVFFTELSNRNSSPVTVIACYKELSLRVLIIQEHTFVIPERHQISSSAKNYRYHYLSL